MEDKREFGYVAKLPSEEGKAKKLGGGSQSPAPNPRKFVSVKEPEDLKEKEMIHRVLNRVRLSTEGWTALKEDLDNRMPKEYISRRFGIKPNDLKYLRRYLGYV